MHEDVDIAPAASALRQALASANQGLIEREALVETIALAAVAHEHVLVIGPPGTAKSQAVRRVAAALGGRYFEYLLGRFTEPSEIFGPVDLRRLREGVVHTETAGMLPEAEIAFLDEVFRGSTAILNTLLGILNERVFRRGHTRAPCPLRVCVGAANDLPEDETLAAFADRFLVRVFVDPIADPRLEELMEGGWTLGQADAMDHAASMMDVDRLATAARMSDLGAVRPHLAHAIRQLRAAGVALTDRRIVKVQRLVAAAAVLAGRSSPTRADLWPIVVAVPTREQQETARECLRETLAESENATLAAAAEEASLGPLARAARLVAAARLALDAKPPTNDPAASADRCLRFEALLREIDGGFAHDALPPDLVEVRKGLADALAASAAGDD